MLCHFNTSNVFIYLPHSAARLCFSIISIHLMFLFICFAIFISSSLSYFNTSNVFIYLTKSSESEEDKEHFNTSDVFIYQHVAYITCNRKQISIHLMFLFMKHGITVLCGLWGLSDKFPTNYPLLTESYGYYLPYFYSQK